jgi:hypothetical protein
MVFPALTVELADPMLNAGDVGAVRLGVVVSVATSVYPLAIVPIEMLPNVATPFTAVAVRVPLSVATPGFAPKESVMLSPLLVATAPLEASTDT